MNKNLNRAIAIGFGMSLMAGNLLPIYAGENTSINKINFAANRDGSYDNGVLTLNDAINAAISNSDKLKMKSKEIKMYKEKLEVQETIDDFIDNDNSFPYDQIELLMDQSKLDKEFMKDQIANDITNKYNDLVQREKEIEKLYTEIEIKEKDIKTMELKKQLGLVTSIENEGAQLELTNLQNSLSTKEEELKNNQDYFKLLTDKDVSSYTLDDSLDVDIFRIDGSVDKYVDDKVDKYLKYNKQLLELMEDNLDDNEVEEPDEPTKPKQGDFLDDKAYQDALINHKPEDGPIPTPDQFPDKEGYAKAMKEYLDDSSQYVVDLNTYGQYLQNQYSTESGLVTLEDSKKALKKGLIDSYTQLVSLENQINLLEQQMNLSKKQLKVAKTQLDLGLITSQDYKKIELKTGDLDTNYRKLINGYDTLKQGIQKPWILSSGESQKK